MDNEGDEILQAWADKAERRYEQLQTGAVKGIPAEEVFARARSRPVGDPPPNPAPHPVYQPESEEKP